MIKKLSLIFVVAITMLFLANGLAVPSEVTLTDLYNAAKAEGKVNLQYHGPVSIIKPIADAFQTKYPDIKISVFSYGATGIATRIIIEASTAKLSLDVATAKLNYFLPLVERNLLIKYDWTKIGVNKNDIHFDGTCISTEDVPNIWVYNKNLVSKADVPKNWEDLLEPKWKGGKISIRAAPTGLTSLFPAWKKDRQKVANYLDKLRRQEVVPGKRAAEVISRIATGECPIGKGPVPLILELIRGNAPVGVCGFGPTATSPSVVAIPQNVPHPNSAKLLVAWLKSPEGRAAYRKIGSGLATPCDASGVAQLLCDNGIQFTPISSIEDLTEFDGAFSKMVVERMGFLPE
jgi:iron(III) transport system substrate-binding protein